MRIFSYLEAGRPAIGVLHPANPEAFVPVHELLPPAPADMTAFLADPDAISALRHALEAYRGPQAHSLAAVRLLPVVPRPGKIICMGLNYAAHAREGGNAIPSYPALFLRAASSQVAHGEPITRPKVSSQLDYEAELAVIIGRKARHLTTASALSCVAGYSIYNDASVRDFQRKSAQWTIGKNFDRTGGFGPSLVTPDELPEGAHGLRIRCILNGQTMQDGNTSDFIWGVAETLTLLSECMTLDPGDVVITGTPAGVGYARKPPVFMRSGDVCEVQIEGIGTLCNPIADE